MPGTAAKIRITEKQQALLQELRRSRTAAVRLRAQHVSRVQVPVRLIQRPVREGNCVLVRGGGEQPQRSNQSVAFANSIRPDVLASLRLNGEASMVSNRSGFNPGDADR